MRHGKKVMHLGRKTAHRKSMLANMSCSLIEHKRINTTETKAKALKRFIEPIINGGLASMGIFRNKNPMTEGRAIAKPKAEAVAMARCMGTLNKVIIGTPNEPPPIPIKTDPNPRITAVNIRLNPFGISSEILQSTFPKLKYNPTQIPKTPNIIIKALELNLAAKITPTMAPKLILKVHFFIIDQSTAFFLW